MDIHELKAYFFNACAFLHIEINEIQPDIYHLVFPKKLHHVFKEEQMNITFLKEHQHLASFITTESYVLQKIAHVVTQQPKGMSHAFLPFSLQEVKQRARQLFSPDCTITFQQENTITQRYLVLWFKFTLKGFKVEESLRAFKYNLATGDISFLPFDLQELFSRVTESKKALPTIENIEEINEKMMKKATKSGASFVKEKTSEVEQELEKEIKRIHDYYDLLQLEDAFAETASTVETREEREESLKSERYLLIEQQKIKYTFHEEDLTIEPVEMVVLTEEIEYCEMTVSNSFGTHHFTLSGDMENPFICSLTKRKDGPFTLISDGRILLQEKARVCTECLQTFDYTQMKLCAVCDTSVCHSCAKRSSLTQAALCSKHATSCQGCRQQVATNEIQECGSCRDPYCRSCLSGELCELCFDLY